MSLTELWSNFQKKKKSTRWLMNADHITDYSLHSINGNEIVYFLIQPTNISVLSAESLSARIYALMNVLKGFAEVEMLCLDSRESFENIKRYLRERIIKEDNLVVEAPLFKRELFGTAGGS